MTKQRMSVARARLAEEPIGGLVVEVGERDPPRPGKHRPLDDAVVDQRVMDDDVVAPEQVPDDGDVGRMAADEDDAILGAVQSGERLFQLAVNRPFAGDRAAGRDRGAVAIDRRLRRRGNVRVAVEPGIIVRGEVDVGFAVDHRFGPGDALMHPEKRIGDPEKRRRLADHADFAEPFELGHGKPRCRLGDCRSGAAAGTPRRPHRRPRGLFQ